MTFQELFEKWYAVKKAEVKLTTLAAYAANWKSISPAIADKQIDIFDRYAAKIVLGLLIQNGLGRKVCQERMSMLKQMLLFAEVELGETIKPLNWVLRFPEKPPQRLQRFTEYELRRILALIRDEFSNCQYRLMPVLISAMTGMRIGEVCGLQWDDIDFQHKMIYVQRNVIYINNPLDKDSGLAVGTPKTRSGYREIPIHPLLSKLLRAAMPSKVDGKHFVLTNSDIPRHPRVARTSLNMCLENCKGVPKVNFHGLRHTFASMLIDHKVDVKTVADILGHADVSTTLNLYVHTSLETKKKAVTTTFRKIFKALEDTSGKP